MESRGRLAQLEEHLLYTQGVTGSSPVPPISPKEVWACRRGILRSHHGWRNSYHNANQVILLLLCSSGWAVTYVTNSQGSYLVSAGRVWCVGRIVALAKVAAVVIVLLGITVGTGSVAFAAPPLLPPPEGWITGTITDTSGNPLKGMCADAYDSDGEYFSTSHATSGGHGGTGPDGKYTLELTSGSWRLRFSYCGDRVTEYAGEYYNDKSTLGSATPVKVTSGSGTPNINAQLAAGGSISGQISEYGNVGYFGDGCVSVYEPDGHEIFFRTTSDESGDYEVAGLPTGSYRLRFFYCGYGSNPDHLASEFYDDQATFSSSTPVQVTAGSDTPNINAQLGLGGSISGTVTDSSGSPLDRICVRAYDSGGRSVDYLDARTQGDGRYKLDLLASGSYRIRFLDCYSSRNIASEFYDDQATFSSSAPVQVTAGSDTPNINAQLGAGGSISGTLTDNFGRSRDGICIDAYDSQGTKVVDSSTTSRRRGLYKITDLAGGSYRIKFHTCAGDPNSVATEFYDNKKDLASAVPVSVTAGADSKGIDAELMAQPGGSYAPGKASIGKLEVGGPINAKKGEIARYQIKIANPGDLTIKGVKLKVSGKGVSEKKWIGKVPAGMTRGVGVRVKFRKAGQVKVKFRVTSNNAQPRILRKRIKVRR